MSAQNPVLRDLKLCRSKALKTVDEMSELYSEDPSVELSQQNALELYVTFAGDVEKTAHALNLKAVDVIRMAEEGNWLERMRSVVELQKSARPGDIERGINRAMSFLQAYEMRIFLQRVIRKLCAMGDAELEKYCLAVEEAADGTITRRMTARPFAELLAALKTCHMLSYLALNDTAAERAKRIENDSDGPSAGELQAIISKAMADPRGSGTPAALLFAEKLKRAQEIIGKKMEAEAPKS